MSYELIEAIKDSKNIRGLTHNFYRYPARFSPIFVREVINEFTDPGDFVLDPFMGGGTTLVEASYLGRKSFGIDINQLAVFISKVKTSILTGTQIRELYKFIQAIDKLNIQSRSGDIRKWVELDYLRNINNSNIWRIRKIIEVVLNKVNSIEDLHISNFIRCALLRTGQWALDGRKNIPSVYDFREHLKNDIYLMIHGSIEYSNRMKINLAEGLLWDDESNVKITNRSAIGLDEEDIFQTDSPKLILMSPPYPGIHVIYHRWQVQGRRETPAPFWIANCMDGSGLSYYTMGDRRAKDQDKYFCQMQYIMKSLRKISSDETIIVQMIAFSNPQKQMERYLQIIIDAGFEEIFIDQNSRNDRIWRYIPNRKWYVDATANNKRRMETVMFHRLR